MRCTNRHILLRFIFVFGDKVLYTFFLCSSKLSQFLFLFFFSSRLHISVFVSLRKQPTFGDATTGFPAK